MIKHLEQQASARRTELGERYLLHPRNAPTRRTPRPSLIDLRAQWRRLSQRSGL